ncbi:MAG: ExbD/TolR family protein [Planctomycetota bacterium]|jgi:biopolymer transport protein ExbD
MPLPPHVLRRKRRKKDAEEISAELDMTSMIDVVFLLLIFFMCATKFKQPEGELTTYLPRDRGTSGGSPVVDPGCRITIYKEGSEIVAWRGNNSRIPTRSSVNEADDLQSAQADYEDHYGLIGPDLDILRQQIQLRKDTYIGGSADGLPVIIAADENVPTMYTVAVVDICKEIGIRAISFAAPEHEY